MPCSYNKNKGGKYLAHALHYVYNPHDSSMQIHTKWHKFIWHWLKCVLHVSHSCINRERSVSLINPFSPTEGILYPGDNDSCLITFHAGWTPEIWQWKQRNDFQLDIWCNKFVTTLSILMTENDSTMTVHIFV